ncbi:metallopeptidase family protein [Arthrobacter alpinus]|nr:metallopeptidase family protein [Arthrobacter alpinus]
MQFKANDGEQSLRISLDPQESDPAREENPAARSFVARRRDRHGRGLRGPVLDAGLPGSRTRGQKFDDLVVDSADRLRTLWPEALATVEYLVEEVPERLEALLASGAQAPLGKYVPCPPGHCRELGRTGFHCHLPAPGGSPLTMPDKSGSWSMKCSWNKWPGS